VFSGIDQERFGRLTPNEERLLDNVKKAFHDSDRYHTEGRVEDCMEPMCRAIDAAKTLRRSLRGEDTGPNENARRFKEFLALEIPAARPDGLQLELIDARTGNAGKYSLADLVYAIRCMTHENENLNAAENQDYHILLDWSTPGPYGGVIKDGRITLNGHFIRGRLREVMAKFITVIDAMIGVARGDDHISMTIRPPLGSVRPMNRRGQ
jgi:hypothetical protein